MENLLKLLKLSWLFADGGAAGGADGAGTGGAGDGTATMPAARTSDQIAAEAGIKMPGSDRRAKQNTTGETTATVYGKQPEGTQAPAAGEQGTQTAEDRAQAFRALIDGEYKQEYKDLFTQESQRVINSRFKETKELQESLKAHEPVMSLLMQRYGITDGDVGKLQKFIEDDDAYWSAAADQAGVDTKTYKDAVKLQRDKAMLERAQKDFAARQAQEAQFSAWMEEAKQIRATAYPGFDLSTEVKNPEFVRMLKSGVPMKAAFAAVHIDDLQRIAVQTATQQTAKAVTENIRAKGMRPDENGASAQGGVTVKSDIHSLTKADRAEIARRVARGEKITF